MLSECFEMESRPSHRSSPHGSHLVRKVVGEEIKLRDLPQGTAISCWWMTLPVFYYLSVIAGGVMSSISVGDVTAAFDNNCVFYAQFTLKGLDYLNGSKQLTRENVEITRYGEMDSCLFPEYSSVACVMYAGVLLVMVLQCGRGGGKSAFRGRGIAESWRIVPVAFIFNLVFLILSSIIFGNIQNGFSTFCDGMNHVDSSKALGNYSSCTDVLQYSFPWDKYNTNLYTEYTLAKIGAYLQLFGSLLAFLTIIVRCLLPADFVVYRRRKIAMVPGIQSSFEDRAHRSEFSQKSGEISTTAQCHTQYEPRTDDGSPSARGYQRISSANTEDVESIKSFHSDTNLVSQDVKVKVVGRTSK